MIEFRVRNQITEQELQEKVGKILTDDDYNILIKRDVRILKPNGQLLAVYRRNVLDDQLLADSYGVLHSLKQFQTNNRGLASGSPRVRQFGGSRTYTKPISSAIIGSFDPGGAYRYCRLTAWSGSEWDQYSSLFPLFRAIGNEFAAQVPERFRVQADFAKRTKPEWVISGTPFTTITVNNTYPTGVHTDKGDLDEGFSCLATLRYGDYSGGYLTFPRFRISVDMQHGDLLLMDAHEWHGNTGLKLESADAERISIVAYFRTNMTECGTGEEEGRKAEDWHGRHQQQQEPISA